MTTTTVPQRALGASGISLPALGIGTDSWGEQLLGYGQRYGEEDLYAAYRACLDAGLDFFDTAEGYGRGESERLLGRFRQRDGRPIRIATKYDNPAIVAPSLARRSPRMLLQGLDQSLLRLGVEQVDLYQIHFAVPRKQVDAYADVLAQAVAAGKVRAVGVSNFNAALMRAMHASLAARGVPLASNQVAYNLLYRAPETNGVLAACRELQITLIAYIPLALGLLTGKYRAGQMQLGRFQKLFFRIGALDLFNEQGAERGPLLRRLLATPRPLRNLEPLFRAMDAVAQARGLSLVQVALSWLLASDPWVIAIPGAKNIRQAQENAGALGWQLTREEYELISRAEIESRGARPSR